MGWEHGLSADFGEKKRREKKERKRNGREKIILYK